MQNLSNSDLKLLILRIFAKSSQSLGKYNFLGKPYTPGALERELSTDFSSDQRNEARMALEELISGNHLRPTMSDTVAPDDWLEITNRGRQALYLNALDELDEALHKIDPLLVEFRRGAWSALASDRPDSLRQAAHSARELIEQTLKTGAPDNEINSRNSFVPDKSSSNGITRRMRARLLMEKNRSISSQSDLEVAEKAIDLVGAIDRKLIAAAHARSLPNKQEITDALTAAEIALRNLLLRP